MPEFTTPPGPTVVILEDDPQQLDLLRIVLMRQRPGWLMRPIQTDQELMARLGSGDIIDLGPPPGVVLADHNLNGATVHELLRAIPAAAGWRVLVLAGDPRPEQEAACLAAGAAGYRPKPSGLTETAELLAVVDELLDHLQSGPRSCGSA